MNKPGGTGLIAIESGTEKMKRGNSFNRTFTKGFYRPFDSSGITNSNASGAVLKNSFNIGNKKNNMLNNKKLLTYLTKKQFFDGINTLFPKKYPTDTILRYMKKYFNIDISEKPFSNIMTIQSRKLLFHSMYLYIMEKYVMTMIYSLVI